MYDVIGKRRWFYLFSALITVPGLLFLLAGGTTALLLLHLDGTALVEPVVQTGKHIDPTIPERLAAPRPSARRGSSRASRASKSNSSCSRRAR